MTISIVELEQCHSTNDEAWKHLSAQDTTAVISKRQLKGRGSQGRQWFQGSDDNLAASVFLPPLSGESFFLPNLTLAAGVAAIDALRLTCPMFASSIDWNKIRLKWPNDIYVGEKKMGGILSESRMTGDVCSGVVVGMGLNITSAPIIDEIATACLFDDVLELEHPSAEQINTFKWFVTYNWAIELQSWVQKLADGKLPELEMMWNHVKSSRL